MTTIKSQGKLSHISGLILNNLFYLAENCMFSCDTQFI